jgi:hypothetical protein
MKEFNMENQLQDPSFIPGNNQSALDEIVNLNREIEIDQNENPGNYQEQKDHLLEKYGQDFSDARLDDFKDFGPESIEPVDENEDYESVLGGISEGGLEAIAFYKSFRFVNAYPAKGRWGIFFIKPIVTNLIREAAFETKQSISAAYEAITRLVYAHEVYHYKVDAFCLQRESVSSMSSYIPYRNYVDKLPMNLWYEEAIANHYGLGAINNSLRRYQCPQSLKEYLYDLIANSPGAYSFGVNKRDQSHFRELLSDQINISTYPSTIRYNNIQSPPKLAYETTLIGLKMDLSGDRTLCSSLSLNKCPVYWITPPNKYGANTPYLQIITVSEIENQFISKYLKGMETRRTDHKFYKIDNGAEIKIPNNHSKNLKIWEFKNIIFKAGLTSSKFFEERLRTKTWSEGIPRNPTLNPRNI